jgi:hypothetical protein
MVSSARETRLAEILSALPDQFRAACSAQREFLDEWQAYKSDQPIEEFFHKFAIVCEAGEPFAKAYREITEEFPEQLDRVSQKLLPIQREYFED